MEASKILVDLKLTPGEDESWMKRDWFKKTRLSAEARTGIIDWLIQCQQYLGLSDSCLHSAVANFDRALCCVEWEPSEIQLLGLAALQLSAKTELDSPPAAKLLLPLAGGVYSKGDLARLELELLEALDWELRQTTASVFLHLYSEMAGKGRKPLFKMAKAVLDLCLYQDWYGCEQPSLLAGSCLAAASSLSGVQWCEELTGLTGACFQDSTRGIRACLSACTEAQFEGYAEKHGKCGRNLTRLQAGIQGIIHNLGTAAAAN